MRQILSGYVLDAFLTPWTLLIKALGLALSVASGLVLGKEVCMMPNIISLSDISSGPTRTCSLLHSDPAFPLVQSVQEQ